MVMELVSGWWGGYSGHLGLHCTDCLQSTPWAYWVLGLLAWEGCMTAETVQPKQAKNVTD